MDLKIQQTLPSTANGIYTVRAPGCVSASLFWANADGALEGWTSFARIPIMPNGEGSFVFDGTNATRRPMRGRFLKKATQKLLNISRFA